MVLYLSDNNHCNYCHVLLRLAVQQKIIDAGRKTEDGTSAADSSAANPTDGRNKKSSSIITNWTI